MAANSTTKWLFSLSVVLLTSLQLIQCNVTYDKKALIINGQRKVLFSGSIHYPRSTPEVFYFPYSITILAFLPRKYCFHVKDFITILADV
jgi:hypothetical protein